MVRCPVRLLASVLSVSLASLAGAAPENASSLETQLQELIVQNRQLEAAVKEQQKLIDALSAKLAALQTADTRQQEAIERLESRPEPEPARETGAFERNEKLRISGEAGLAFFRTGSAGQYPNAEFRVDDAKLFFEVAAARNTYLFAGLDVTTREANDEYFHVGELYVDFEEVAALWGGPTQALTLRAGRFNIPFGEEYQVRGVMANPLVSHSLSDIWGIDEGVEAYGTVGKFNYVVAVQNGGHKTLHDYNSDKAMIARIGYRPASWLALSASAMRTGALAVNGDSMSELWFGNGFFRALGPAATTTEFSANLFEGDAVATWDGGHVRAAAGEARFDDNDTAADNARRLRYYFLEGLQNLSERLYAAARVSEIHADRGYPLVGWGDFGTFFYRSPGTERLWRVSVGFGYRIAEPVVWKVEYTAEGGRLVNGASRSDENLLSTELALRF